MFRVRRSALFKRQFLEVAKSYRERAGTDMALKFVDQAESCIRFIKSKPLACAVYMRVEGYEFRKWSLKGFPVSIFFRLESADTLVLEALYAHRMNIAARLRDTLRRLE